MSLTYGFYNSVGGDRKYDARDISSIFNGIINDGVFASVGGALAVSPGGGMSINVAEGRAWFNGTWTNNDSIMTLQIDQAGLGLNRIDVVILEVNTNTEVRANSIKVLKGIPSATAVAPSLTNNEMIHQIPLAHIAVNAGITSITADLITNKIGTSACPFVTGILEVVDIDFLLAQWDADFNTWFANLENVLDENTAANLLNLINNNTNRLDDIDTSVSNIQTLMNDIARTPYTTIRNGKDSNGIYTEILVKRLDSTVIKKSTLSGGVSPKYTTRTVIFYGDDGTVIDTLTYTLNYTGDDLTSEVIN